VFGVLAFIIVLVLLVLNGIMFIGLSSLLFE
jgi:hypothetical protein